MKLFVYYLGTIRNGAKDGVVVLGGENYHHDQPLLVIEAESAEQAAKGIGRKIVDVFDRSNVKCPNINYVHDAESSQHRNDEGAFFFAIKEITGKDEGQFRGLGPLIKRAIRPKFPKKKKRI